LIKPMMDSPQSDTETKKDRGDLPFGPGMSPAHEPYRPSRGWRLLRAMLSVGGGVVYLFVNAIASITLGTRAGLGGGLLLWIAASAVTFRWYSRDVSLDVDRGAKARFKRGAWFAFPFVAFPLAVVLLARLHWHVLRALKPEALADLLVLLVTLAPLAFGIGAITSSQILHHRSADSASLKHAEDQDHDRDDQEHVDQIARDAEAESQSPQNQQHQ
jgi:hypothetical protein